jgi:hypothetical protein
MGLFDYDARPATPQVQLVGDRSSAAAYALRAFSRETDFPTTGRRWMAPALGLHWGTDEGSNRGATTRQWRLRMALNKGSD